MGKIEAVYIAGGPEETNQEIAEAMKSAGYEVYSTEDFDEAIYQAADYCQGLVLNLGDAVFSDSFITGALFARNCPIAVYTGSSDVDLEEDSKLARLIEHAGVEKIEDISKKLEDMQKTVYGLYGHIFSTGRNKHKHNSTEDF